MADFEFIEHTADIGIRVYGGRAEDLFINAARGLFSLLVDYVPDKKIEKKIVLEEGALEDLFINWLNELISLFYADKILPVEYNVVIHDDGIKKVLEAVIRGEEFSPYENKVNMEIKAATYHNLKVEYKDNRWVAEVIFDV